MATDKPITTKEQAEAFKCLLKEYGVTADRLCDLLGLARAGHGRSYYTNPRKLSWDQYEAVCEHLESSDKQLLEQLNNGPMNTNIDKADRDSYDRAEEKYMSRREAWRKFNEERPHAPIKVDNTNEEMKRRSIMEAAERLSGYDLTLAAELCERLMRDEKGRKVK